MKPLTIQAGLNRIDLENLWKAGVELEDDILVPLMDHKFINLTLKQKEVVDGFRKALRNAQSSLRETE